MNDVDVLHGRRETDTAICRCDVATVQRFLWAIPFVRTTFSGIESTKKFLA